MVLATKKNCQRVLAAGLRVVSAMTGNPPLVLKDVDCEAFVPLEKQIECEAFMSLHSLYE